MDFGKAFEALKANNKVARHGWNDKGMWLQLYTPRDDEGLVATINGTGKWLPLAPHIIMKTADDEFVPWLASQTDLLAEDYSIVE